MGRCGTSSLQANLYSHPEIDFTRGVEVEDVGIYASGQRNQFFPSKSRVQQHKTSWTWRKKNSSVRLGLRNPAISTYALSYYTIFMQQKSKVILIICDPLSRMEKQFMWFHYCHDDMDKAVARHDAGLKTCFFFSCKCVAKFSVFSLLVLGL